MAKAKDGILDKAKKKIKRGVDYVNDNINPLTSKRSREAAASYMGKAKKQSLAGQMTNVNTRMERLGDPGAPKSKRRK